MNTTQTQRYVLSIDLGSSDLKAALVDSDGRIVASADEPTGTTLFPGGGAEQDPVQWWQNAKKAATAVIARAGVPAEAIVAVACDSQWSVVVPVNERAEPLMGAVHWLDTRGGKYNRQVTGGFPGIQGYQLWKLMRWIRLTGLAPTHTGVDSMGHVLFIKNERPDIYRQTFKFLEPMDYLTARLSGRIVATQKTMAPFIITDNRVGEGRYSDTLLRMAGLDRDKFPDLIANNGIVGSIDPAVAGELGLTPATQVVAGTGDLHATIIGSGAVRDFEAIIYIGTTLYMSCHMPFKKTDLARMMTALPCAFPDRYILLGEQGLGGKCVEFFLKNILYDTDDFEMPATPEDAYQRFNTVAASAPPGSSGVIFLPWLNGSWVPCENPHVRGGFVNLSIDTRRRHLARAVMEGLAFNSRWTREPAEKMMGRPFTRFIFSGGGALSDLWAQIHADILGVPIHQVADPLTSTARGTALLALTALGHLSVDQLPAMVPIRQVFEPDPSTRATYDRLYTGYRRLFFRNKEIFAALNAHARD
ncbi:FGGY-family carbohydrate kinase [Desulfosarcina sp.]|uniref:xylulokinase n=1 Tax=Desulfosarcina sp. TaxID=2027861 RepID=UPI00356AB752